MLSWLKIVLTLLQTQGLLWGSLAKVEGLTGAEIWVKHSYALKVISNMHMMWTVARGGILNLPDQGGMWCPWVCGRKGRIRLLGSPYSQHAVCGAQGQAGRRIGLCIALEHLNLPCPACKVSPCKPSHFHAPAQWASYTTLILSLGWHRASLAQDQALASPPVWTLHVLCRHCQQDGRGDFYWGLFSCHDDALSAILHKCPQFPSCQRVSRSKIRPNSCV